ncbi:MAG: DUF480 domain-containing protein [Chromatiaceae bacterium]|nr:MAG: DUF480 domain-containing protein [Chromatiaceae bacterium]
MNASPAPGDPMLTPVEARVLGCLMEKQRTTPEQYPLTLNALVTACNQKTSREPIMRLSPGEVGHTLGELRDRGLVHVSFTGRAERYDHKLAGTFMLDRRAQALLCALLLRGPQTPGELRTNTARLASFDDLASLLDSLQALAGHNPPLVRELPRQPGLREQRYAHLLCGEPAVPAARLVDPPATSPADPDLAARVAALEAEVAALRAAVAALQTPPP